MTEYETPDPEKKDEAINEAFEMLTDDDLRSFAVVTRKSADLDLDLEMAWFDANKEADFADVEPDMQVMLGHAINSIAAATGMEPLDIATGVLQTAQKQREVQFDENMTTQDGNRE
jgi:N-acyl-D-aspartate/D-glutamate deacylase